MSTMELKVKRFGEMTPEELYGILKARVDIFVVEQKCPYPELDGLDRDAVHVWLEEDGEILAYLRVMDRGAESEDVSIGRVLATKRKLGLGTRILQEGIRTAKEYFGAERIYLEAQDAVKSFYEKQGFRTVSDVFPLDGIPHVKMILDCRL